MNQAAPGRDMIYFLGSLPLFAGLSEEILAGLIAQAQLTGHQKQTTLFHRGDVIDKLFIPVSGQIKLSRVTRDGDEAILALAGRGEAIGTQAILSPDVHAVTGETVQESWVLEIPRQALYDAARSAETLLSNIMRQISTEMRLMRIEKEQLMLMTASQRVGCVLLQQWRKTMKRDSDLAIPGNKALTAARLGMQPETFSRSLAQLEKAGVTTTAGRTRIGNVAQLMDYCCEHCSAVADECSQNAAAQATTGR